MATSLPTPYSLLPAPTARRLSDDTPAAAPHRPAPDPRREGGHPDDQPAAAAHPGYFNIL